MFFEYAFYHGFQSVDYGPAAFASPGRHVRNVKAQALSPVYWVRNAAVGRGDQSVLTGAPLILMQPNYCAWMQITRNLYLRLAFCPNTCWLPPPPWKVDGGWWGWWLMGGGRSAALDSGDLGWLLSVSWLCDFGQVTGPLFPHPWSRAITYPADLLCD